MISSQHLTSVAALDISSVNNLVTVQMQRKLSFRATVLHSLCHALSNMNNAFRPQSYEQLYLQADELKLSNVTCTHKSNLGPSWRGSITDFSRKWLLVRLEAKQALFAKTTTESTTIVNTSETIHFYR